MMGIYMCQPAAERQVAPRADEYSAAMQPELPKAQRPKNLGLPQAARAYAQQLERREIRYRQQTTEGVVQEVGGSIGGYRRRQGVFGRELGQTTYLVSRWQWLLRVYAL